MCQMASFFIKLLPGYFALPVRFRAITNTAPALTSSPVIIKSGRESSPVLGEAAEDSPETSEELSGASEEDGSPLEDGSSEEDAAVSASYASASASAAA